MKVFEAINTLTFAEDNSVSEMNSKEGETIEFVEVMHTREKNVEVWMTEVEFSMVESVRKSMETAIEAYPQNKVEDRTQWVLDHPGQCVLNGSQSFWTLEVETRVERFDRRGTEPFEPFELFQNKNFP